MAIKGPETEGPGGIIGDVGMRGWRAALQCGAGRGAGTRCPLAFPRCPGGTFWGQPRRLAPDNGHPLSGFSAPGPVPATQLVTFYHLHTHVGIQRAQTHRETTEHSRPPLLTPPRGRGRDACAGNLPLGLF